MALEAAQLDLIETVRRFVRRELVPLEEEVERTGALAPDVARALTAKAKEAGVFACNMPTERGGAGLSVLETALVEEEFGWTTDILIRRSYGCVYEVMLAANEDQVKRWLEPTVNGDRIFAVAFTETGAGSDAAGIKTRALKTNGCWTLTGAKHFISDADFADYFVVTAVTDPEAKHNGISLFLVNKDDPGVKVGRRQAMMGNAGTGTYELFFDGVNLPADRLLGAEGEGLKLMLSMLGRVRLTQIGARNVGRMVRLVHEMTEYANNRRQFGNAIGEYQMVQAMLADSALDLLTSRALVHSIARRMDQGLDVRAELSVVKVVTSEALGRVADRAVQIFGGMGYSKESIAERLYRDARVARIFDGTSEIHRSVIAKTMLKKGCGWLDLTA
jgi:acyl-CoA dehydrogenase